MRPEGRWLAFISCTYRIGSRDQFRGYLGDKAFPAVDTSDGGAAVANRPMDGAGHQLRLIRNARKKSLTVIAQRAGTSA